MNKEAIKKILPHREPMLLVDEVELIDGVAHGKCHIKGDEYFPVSYTHLTLPTN